MDISLMRDIEDELVGRRAEDAVHGDGQFHHAQIWPEMTAHGSRIILGEHPDKLIADFLGKIREVLFAEFFHPGRGSDGWKKPCCHEKKVILNDVED